MYGGVFVEIVNYFRNGTPLEFVIVSIIWHLIPMFLDLKKEYNYPLLICSVLLYLLFVGNKFPMIYDNPWKYLKIG